MESYFIQVYHRGVRNPEIFKGTIEEVGSNWKKVFRNFDELWLMLISPKQSAAGAEGQSFRRVPSLGASPTFLHGLSGGTADSSSEQARDVVGCGT